MVRQKVKAASVLLVGYFIPFSISPYVHLYYMFMHASLLHLVINMYAVFLCTKDRTNLLHVYILGVIAYLLSQSDKPTVGASGLVYIMLGMNVFGAWRSFLIGAAFTLFSCFMPGVNYKIHIISFIFGLIYSAIEREYKSYNEKREYIKGKR